MTRAAAFVFALLVAGCPKGSLPSAEIQPDNICYALGTGTTIATTRGAGCPTYEALDWIAHDVAQHYNLLGDPRWFALVVTLVPDFTIDCGYFDRDGRWRGRDAMGCTELEKAQTKLSLWPTWSWQANFRHELIHFAIYLQTGGGDDPRHQRLDDKEYMKEHDWP